jgi:uncharacterized protein (TIGR02246 family)
MPTLLEDRDAIRDVMARYCLYIDAARGDEWASLFTEDATFDTRMGDPVVGRDALAAMCRMTPPGTMHHMFTNLVIDVDGDEAVCDASAIVMSKGSIMMSAHTHDELQRVDGEWRIKFRTYEPDPQ